MSQSHSSDGSLQQPHVEVHASFQVHDVGVREGRAKREEEAAGEVGGQVGRTPSELVGVFHEEDLEQLQEQKGVVQDLQVLPGVCW